MGKSFDIINVQKIAFLENLKKENLVEAIMITIGMFSQSVFEKSHRLVEERFGLGTE